MADDKVFINHPELGPLSAGEWLEILTYTPSKESQKIQDFFGRRYLRILNGQLPVYHAYTSSHRSATSASTSGPPTRRPWRGQRPPRSRTPRGASARCCATRRWARRPRSRPRRPRLPGSSPKRPPLRRARCLLGSISQLSHSQRYQPLCQPSAPASRLARSCTLVSATTGTRHVVSGYCEGTMKIFGCLHRTLKISGRLHPFSHHSESTLKTFGLFQT